MYENKCTYMLLKQTDFFESKIKTETPGKSYVTSENATQYRRDFVLLRAYPLFFFFAAAY